MEYSYARKHIIRMHIKLEKRWHKHIVAIVAYALITLAMTYPLAFRLNQLPIDVTDPERHLHRDSFIFLWNFWWLKHAIFDLHSQPFFTNLLYYPHGTSLVFLPFTGVYATLSLPFQCLQSPENGVITAYSVIVLGSFILAAYAAYLLAAEVVGSLSAAFVAGLVFSFCANRIWNLSALNLFCFEFVALFAFALVLLLKEPTVRRGMWAGVAFSLLLYSSLEYSLFSSALVVMLTLAFCGGKKFDSDYLKALVKSSLAASASFIVLVSPLLIAIWSFTREGTLQPAKMNLDMPVAFSNDLLSFVIPSFQQRFYDSLINFSVLYSKGIDWRIIGLKSFLGYTALALAMVGIAGAPGRQKWLWTFLLCLFVLLSMGPYVHVRGNVYDNIPLPYLFLWKSIPFFQVARGPERMIVLVMLALSVLSAYGVKAVCDRVRLNRIIIAASVGFLVLLENFAGPFKTGFLPWPSIYREIQRETVNYAILDIPDEEDMRPISMYYQIVHQKPILGGQVPRHSAQSMDFINSDSFLRAVSLRQFSQYYLDLVANPERAVEMLATRRKLVENNTKYIFLHTWHMSHQDEVITRKLIEMLAPVEITRTIPYMNGEIIVYRLY